LVACVFAYNLFLLVIVLFVPLLVLVLFIKREGLKVSFSHLGANERGFTVWAKTCNYGGNLVDLCCFAL
jgi:hypothetical protein